ncbi:unnamed protein product [marine sediment metagenome]|uniref:Sialidase domain-containing protein n=1 Tax=marine sediment metagenome TaxID=412755 RepID=X0UJA4_9ZZZZ
MGVENDGNGNIIVIASSGIDKRIRIYKIDPLQMSWELLSVLGNAEMLKIDPAIEKVKDKWFITITSIEGTANNPDPNMENGTYNVEIYSSGNLIDWERLSTIISRKSNIEDSRLYYSNRLNKFLFLFEQEDYDKGPSSLKMIESGDMGETWTNEQFVLKAIADSEPAGMFEIGGSLYVFFSSDIDNPGKSYEGGNAFYLYSKNGLNSWSSINKVELGDSILLIDVIMAGNKMYFAAFRNYLTSRQMMLFNGILTY